MCRLAAYAGPPIRLSELLYETEHSLEHQAYAPRELVFGNVNVDGTGVAWWQDGETDPLRYVTAHSPWADVNLPHLSRRLTSRLVLAAVRSATPGLAYGPDQVAPFVAGSLAGAHNGWIQGFRSAPGREVVSRLSTEGWGDLGVLNDSKALFLSVVDAHRGDLADAMQTALTSLKRILDGYDLSAALNLVVTDGTEIVASRYSIRAPHNSLYVAGRGDAHLIASEPLDGGSEWKPVPEGHLVSVTASGLTIRPVEDE